MKNKFIRLMATLTLTMPLLFLLTSCEDEDSSGLAPYAGSAKLSNISIEANFRPKISWLGGYVSVIGVNRGANAALDTSLVWLIRTDGNNIRYQTQFGTTPQGATDITTQFGGTKIDSLSEDEVYTFWVMKSDVWSEVSQHPNSKLSVDTLLTSSLVVNGDSVKVNPFSLAQAVKPLDVYINITGLTQFGRLGKAAIEQVNSETIISWSITETGVTDTNLSAIGIVEGQQYAAEFALWDVYSESLDSLGNPVYGRINLIQSPVQAGDSIAGTRTFVTMPAEGLERGKTYYLWIANNNWNRSSRTRTTTGYAWATFNVQ